MAGRRIRFAVLLGALGLLVGGGASADALKVKYLTRVRHGEKPKVRFEIGEPVTITWKVKGDITRQELWLADMHDDHPSKVLLIDGDIRPGKRSYTWTPTEEFSSSSAQFIVRAQNDEEFMGTDSRSKGRVEVGDGHDHPEARRCSCPAGKPLASKPLARHGR